jgi:hypothetical protein
MIPKHSVPCVIFFIAMAAAAPALAHTGAGTAPGVAFLAGAT